MLILFVYRKTKRFSKGVQKSRHSRVMRCSHLLRVSVLGREPMPPKLSPLRRPNQYLGARRQPCLASVRDLLAYKIPNGVGSGRVVYFGRVSQVSRSTYPSSAKLVPPFGSICFKCSSRSLGSKTVSQQAYSWSTTTTSWKDVVDAVHRSSCPTP